MASRLSSLLPNNLPFTEDSTELASRALTTRIGEAIRSFAPLSLIAFGGPPAHIALLQNTFVVRKKWLDETLFAEFFAISQALPGPGSTEMLFSIAIHRGGLIPAIVAFFCWSLPGLAIMTGLGIGVGELPNPLPPWLLQIQNGISAAAVGLVAQAGTALSRKTVTDKPTLAVCTLAAATATLYAASWLEPCLIALGGMVTFAVAHCQEMLARRRRRGDALWNVDNPPLQGGEGGVVEVAGTETDDLERDEELVPMKDTPAGHMPFSWKTGTAIFAIWFGILIAFVALKDTVADIRPLAVLMQFYVAGCIIFGGGPVVIPLLYSYVVVPGWVTERDFLLGIALIQAMPGPNFNIAAYCGSLALSPWGALASLGGGFLGYVGIFAPGLAMNAAALPLWQKVRKSDALCKSLPGINAAAVGLVFAAAYLLWQRGVTRGGEVEPLGNRPYYAVVAGCSYVLVNAGVRTPYVMLLSCLAGLVGWGLNI